MSDQNVPEEVPAPCSPVEAIPPSAHVPLDSPAEPEPEPEPPAARRK